MGVYIKDIEMPKHCLACELRMWDERAREYYCPFDSGVPLLRVGILNNCPLIEVPEPHGRLIDADKLFDDEKLCYGVMCEECQFLYDTENILECCKVERMIKDAPTVIEGSE